MLAQRSSLILAQLTTSPSLCHRDRLKAKHAQSQLLPSTPSSLALLADYSKVILKQSEARQVNIKTSDGDMGILSNHVPAILQLIPGILEIHGDKITKYFVSGGFATVNADSSMHINAVEACLLDQIDQGALKTEIDATRKALLTATGEKKALLQIEMSVYEEIEKSK